MISATHHYHLNQKRCHYLLEHRISWNNNHHNEGTNCYQPYEVWFKWMILTSIEKFHESADIKQNRELVYTVHFSVVTNSAHAKRIICPSTAILGKETDWLGTIFYNKRGQDDKLLVYVNKLVQCGVFCVGRGKKCIVWGFLDLWAFGNCDLLRRMPTGWEARRHSWRVICETDNTKVKWMEGGKMECRKRRKWEAGNEMLVTLSNWKKNVRWTFNWFVAFIGCSKFMIPMTMQR